MGITKTDLFTSEQNEIANIAKAFSHPARIAIIQYLIKANACINGDLVQELGLAQATISQHLKELKDAQIIQGTIEGSKINYCLNIQRLNEIKHQFNPMIEQIFKLNENNCC